MRGRFLLLLLSGLTVVLVVLSSCCKCVQWNPVTVTWTGSSPQTWTGNCGDSTAGISIYSGTPVSINSSVQCSSGCNASYNWTVTQTAGGAQVWTGNSLPFSFSPTSSGAFTVALNASCNGTACPTCTIIMEIDIKEPGP
jgi:hypothetical protein